MEKKIETVISALKNNRIECIYAPEKKDVKGIVKELLFKGAVITTGGSVSVKESGVLSLISSGEYEFFDRNREGITEEERLEAYRQTIGSDFYFCSANAVTEKGELINVDGNGNRVAAISFGPKKVIMIVGCNKIVKDTNEGFLRIKNQAAPKNCQRLGIKTPCSKIGHCASLEFSGSPGITDGCDFSRRICSQYLISGKQMNKDRITVILCGEELGY